LWGRAGEGGSRERRPILTAGSKPNRPPSLTLPHEGGGKPLHLDDRFFLQLIAS
jgi:hypothetical protein